MLEIDGHDTDAIRDAIITARSVTDQPSMIACRTIIGFGFPTKAGTQKAHSDAPGEEEIAGARNILAWDAPPFVIPEPLLTEWRTIGAKGAPGPHGLGRTREAGALTRSARSSSGATRAGCRRTGGRPSPRPAPEFIRDARNWRPGKPAEQC